MSILILRETYGDAGVEGSIMTMTTMMLRKGVRRNVRKSKLYGSTYVKVCFEKYFLRSFQKSRAHRHHDIIADAAVRPPPVRPPPA